MTGCVPGGGPDPSPVRPAGAGAVAVTVVVRGGDGRTVVDEHVRVELPSPRAGVADVLVVAEGGRRSWAGLGERDRELAAAHPGALVTLIVRGPNLALVRIGAASPGRVRRADADPPWPRYASILHALTVLGAAGPG